jgi:putative copper export protein
MGTAWKANTSSSSNKAIVDNMLQALTAWCNGFFDLLFSLICGMICAMLWGGIPIETRGRLRGPLAVSAGFLCFLSVIRAYVLAVTMLGTSQPRAVLHEFSDVLLSTHAGHVLLPQLFTGLLITIFPLAFSSKRFYIPLIATLFFVLSIFSSASGHASSDGDFALREICQWVHLISTGIWSGGVMAAGWFTFRDRSAEFPVIAARRLSKQSLLAVVFVMISGACNTWLSTNGALMQIPHYAWGWVLVLKLVLVAVALVLGGVNRKTLQAVTENRTREDHFICRLRSEAFFMVLILLISGWLGTLPPVGE